jgi:predicted nucleotidyltransferase
MNREFALAVLTDAMGAQGVASAYLFGSTIRDEARPDSDLDIVIHIASGSRFSLFDLLKIQHFLEDELGREVDLTTRDSLHPLLRAEIERDAVRWYDGRSHASPHRRGLA